MNRPKKPPICTEEELTFIEAELDNIQLGTKVTLRKIRAAVDYFIQKQEFDESGK